MDLVEQYQRQENWRRWDDAVERVAISPGEKVLDLGCGLGQVANRLNRRGADVVGLDLNEELLDSARNRFPSVRFEVRDLCKLDCSPIGPVNGIWASFVAAYFADLNSVLKRWRECLLPGGWIALVEMDDLLGHAPLPDKWASQVALFYDEARNAGRYDFLSGRRLATALTAADFDIVDEGTLGDDELCFQGAAPDEIFQAWQQRLQRMDGLKKFLGPSFADFQRDFLTALMSPAHSSTTRVIMVVARRR